MSYMDELKALGVNVEEGLDRVMGDSDLYEMMLGMFIDSVESSAVKLEEFDAPDVTGLTERIHMLKGVTGNLSIAPLFITYTEVLGLLRSGENAKAKENYQKLLPDQEKVLECIKRHKAG